MLLDEEMVFLPGKKYAIVGQNQAGKSTLSHILCKLYEPQEGSITLNGINYKDIPRQSVRYVVNTIHVH